MPTGSSARNLSFTLTLLGLCAAFVCIAVFSVKDDSYTADEIAHIPAGFVALKEQNLIINLDHPPLIKIIAAVPLLFQNVNHSADLTSGAASYELHVIDSFYPLNRKNFDTILFSARVAVIVLNAFLLFISAVLLRQLFSPVIALLSVFFIAFEPTFLAHARYVTTDIGASVFPLLALISFSIFLKKGNNTYIWLTSLFLGAALLSKISCVFIYLFISGFLLFHELSHIGGSKRLKALFYNLTLTLVVPWVILYVVYFGAALHVNTNQLEFKAGAYLHTRVLTGEKSIFLRPFVLYAIGFRHGFMRSQLEQGVSNGPQYLNGEVRVNRGWWYYFPLALFYKETPGMLILFALSLILFLRKGTELTEKLLLSYCGIYLVISLRSSLNIGIRHLLPMITVLTLLSILVLSRWQFWIKYKLWYVAAAFQLFSVVSVYPYYLGYFNVFAGGPANGYKHLLDSNLDWGQNLKRLYMWAQENKIESMTVYPWYAHHTDLFSEGKIFKRKLTLIDSRPKGYVAVSVMLSMLGKDPQCRGFLRYEYEYLEKTYLEKMKPVTVVANTYFIYYFP
ncbi:MAG: glycosyltransferase family 39 protein [Nitrospirae bacterium]|nr:glycosyltransferase family 39 protein [Nitrospirota bacterium]